MISSGLISMRMLFVMLSVLVRRQQPVRGDASRVRSEGLGVRG